jgi:hypothetical protein
MIKIRDYEIKSSLTEWTIGEYENIINILSDDKLDFIDKYIKVLELLGLPDEVLDKLGDDEFFEIVQNILDNNIDNNFKKEFELHGYTYRAYEGDEYKLSVRDMAKIENIIKSDDVKLSRILAVIFKREDLTNTEHYDKAHLDYKAKIFKELNADIVIPYILLIEKKMVKKLVYLNESQSNN